MPAKKKKIIKKRKINKAGVKRIPKYPNIKPNINLSPYDIATLVQQKFKQDMEADNVRIEKRQAELAAERKAIKSPEFKKALDEHTKSLMSLQQEIATQKEEMRRAQVDSQREFERSPAFREMMNELVSVRRHAEHSEEMRKSENEKIMSEIERRIQSTQEAWEQRLEQAQLDRETQHMKQVNDRIDKLEDEKAKYEARVSEAKGAAHAEGLKRTQKKVEQNAQAAAKVKVQAEHEEEALAITKEGQKNIKRQAYIETLQKEGPEMRRKEGEAMAKVELENQRLEAEIASEKKKHKLLMEKEIVAKESQKIIADLQGQIQAIKSSDPTSRLTGDPALIEVDLFMLGEEQEKYKEAQRKLAETRYHQHAMQNLNKEVDELAKAIRDSGQGIEFSQLYGKDPSAIVAAMRNLVQLKQGRRILTENLPSIFPSLQTRLIEIEQRSQQLASREQSITSREQRMREKRKY